jgi:hypothetical protein
MALEFIRKTASVQDSRIVVGQASGNRRPKPRRPTLEGRKILSYKTNLASNVKQLLAANGPAIRIREPVRPPEGAPDPGSRRSGPMPGIRSWTFF